MSSKLEQQTLIQRVCSPFHFIRTASTPDILLVLLCNVMQRNRSCFFNSRIKVFITPIIRYFYNIVIDTIILLICCSLKESLNVLLSVFSSDYNFCRMMKLFHSLLKKLKDNSISMSIER